MANFDEAVKVVLLHEGGLADNPADPGGITNFGISIRFLRDILRLQISFGVHISIPSPVTADFIRNLKESDAVSIYKACWWDFFHYELINDQTAATKLFDAAVNMGPPSKGSAGTGPAHACAQRAINDCGGHSFDSGILTQADTDAINEYGELWVKAMCLQMAQHYKDIVDKRPASAVFLSNWLHRAYWPYRTAP